MQDRWVQAKKKKKKKKDCLYNQIANQPRGSWQNCWSLLHWLYLAAIWLAGSNRVLLGQFVSSKTAMPRKSCRLDEEVFEFRIDRLKRMQMLLQHWDRDRWNSWSQSSWWSFEVWFSMFWHTSDRYTVQIIFYDDDMMFRYV